MPKNKWSIRSITFSKKWLKIKNNSFLNGEFEKIHHFFFSFYPTVSGWCVYNTT